jgi:type IV pilus assembly protein PilO
MALPPLDSELKKKLLVGVVLFLGLGYLFYDYLYVPRQTEVNAMESRLANIRLQNSTARGLTSGTASGDVEARLRLYRDQLAAVEGLIPSAEELPDLLDAISVQAQRTGVEISLIQPVGATEEQFYTRRTYDMAVLGSYHDIGEFLTRVASLQRIVTPINLVIAPQTAPAAAGGAAPAEAAPRLEARFSIETYVIPSGQPTDAASTE